MLGLMSQTYPPEPTSAVVPVNLEFPETLAFHRLEVNMSDIAATNMPLITFRINYSVI